MANCLEYAKERTNECTVWEEQGYVSCADWDAKCCTWWPCSWGCKLLTLVCIGYTFISKLVCVGWVWISTGICLAWEAVTTIVGAIIDTIEFIINPILIWLLTIVELIFSIPLIGRFLKWVWNLAATVLVNIIFTLFSGILDAAAYLAGIRPQKKLRICTLIMRNEQGQPLIGISAVVDMINETIKIFHREANIQILNSTPVQYHNNFRREPRTADESWVQVLPGTGSSSALDVRCDGPGFLEDLGTEGSERGTLILQHCQFGLGRRILNYGAPVTVLIVRSVDSGLLAGCALGPFTDYVVVAITSASAGGGLSPGTPVFSKARNPLLATLAHELGHKCNLLHVSSINNLII